MNIEPRTPLELLRDQLEECRKQLIFMGSPEGQPSVIQNNIRHKQAQARALEERIRAMSAGHANRNEGKEG